jgi:hypothetical protein
MHGSYMKKIFIILNISILLSATNSYSQYYNNNNGNSYRVTPTYGGGARVNGFNYNTGAAWNTNIQNNGNMNGVDSRGNYWNYNSNSGTYFNSNGVTCFGKGAFRTCN